MAERSPTSSYSRPDRSHLKTVVAFVDPELAVDLKHRAIDEGVTVQALAALGIRIVRDGLADRDKKIVAAVKQLKSERVPTGPKPAAVAVKTA